MKRLVIFILIPAITLSAYFLLNNTGADGIKILTRSFGLSSKRELEPESDRRLALLIGNSDYVHTPLPSALNDCLQLTEVLTDQGFKVTSLKNVNYQQMTTAIRQFGEQMQKNDVALFYFAGHIFQYKGHNFLLPLKAEIAHREELELKAVDLGLILTKMARARENVKIVLLDSGYLSSQQELLGIPPGLSLIDAPTGTIISYATAPNTIIRDIPQQHSLYSKNLNIAVTLPGLSIEDIFKEVRNNVKEESRGKQIPWEATSLETSFYFSNIPDKSETEQQIIFVESPKQDVDSNLAYSLLVKARERKQLANENKDIKLFAQCRHDLDKALTLVSQSNRAYKEILDERYLHLPWMEINFYLTENRTALAKPLLDEFTIYLEKNTTHSRYLYYQQQITQLQHSFTVMDNYVDRSNKEIGDYLKLWLENYKKFEGFYPRDMKEFQTFLCEYAVKTPDTYTFTKYQLNGSRCFISFVDAANDKHYQMEFDLEHN